MYEIVAGDDVRYGSIGTNYTLSFVHSGKVLDVFSGSATDSAGIIQYGYHGSNHEQWQLVRL